MFCWRDNWQGIASLYDYTETLLEPYAFSFLSSFFWDSFPNLVNYDFGRWTKRTRGFYCNRFNSVIPYKIWVFGSLVIFCFESGMASYNCCSINSTFTVGVNTCCVPAQGFIITEGKNLYAIRSLSVSWF